MTLTDFLSQRMAKAFEDAGFAPTYAVVRVSDRPDLCQFQCNGALATAKTAKQQPRKIAETIVADLEMHTEYSSVSIAGPGFINIDLSDTLIVSRLSALAKSGDMAEWKTPSAQMILVDYGGPNIAKPLHVGHLRSAIIGEALKNLLRLVGHSVIGDIHLGDWGLPMGQLISEIESEQPDLVYFDQNFTGPYPDDPPFTLADLERLYPQASAACKESAKRAEIAKAATTELQNGRPGYRALWRHFIDVSRAAIEREYADLGVSFDLWKGESDAHPFIENVSTILRDKGLSVIDDGAEIVPVARDDDTKEIPPLILFKSDGSVLYGTTDLATIFDRVQTHKPDSILYVVDQRQSLHFEQVFRTASSAGLINEDQLEHIGFGTMNGKDGKPFKTRSGGVLKLRDLIDMVDERAKERLEESGFAKGLNADEAETIARKVGVSALKFADLSNPRTTDYIFDLDRFLAFEGKTGPYLLYASVRIRSVLEKAGIAADKQASMLDDTVFQISSPEERELSLKLLQCDDVLRSASEKRLPHLLCEHAFSLAQAFSKFYAAQRIADEENASLRQSRLAFAALTGRQLEGLLGILGIDVPERM
ncbi:MAG: arginine--tRNA ligase [Pseudomonadota bacterium]